MANNRLQTVAFLLTIAAAFVAGGWFFSRQMTRNSVSSEVENLYSKDAESLGIFDKIPVQDMAAANRIADEALQEQTQPADGKMQIREDGRGLPSQIMLTDLTEIAGIAPHEDEGLAEPSGAAAAPTKSVAELNLTGNEIASLVPTTLPAIPDGEQSQITMIAAPVKYFVIKNIDEYKEFKRRARGNYPEIDFTKQMLIVLESDSNLPDNVFELISAEDKEGNLMVNYRVSVFRLDKKLNSHTVLPVTKTTSAIQLKQVL